MNNKTFLVFTATFTLCVIFTSDMQAAYAGQSDVDAGLPISTLCMQPACRQHVDCKIRPE